ncbi:MAG: PEGA domain-containing protein [Methanoregula sp.]
MLVALVLCIHPVFAAESKVSIAYRGAGGSYIGDTIIFDGYNHAGNTTVLRLTGPDLPAGGIPVYDLNGQEGTGNPVVMNEDGSWRFVWYTSSIKGVDKMQTARYYITAYDLNDPTQTATTSVMMKKPDFFVVATPNPLETGEYLQLVGTSEMGAVDIRVQVTDVDGKVLHTYDTAASKSGYFTYAFHVDMQPGDYYVTVSSPSIKTTYRTVVTVSPPQTPAVNETPVSPQPSGLPGQNPQAGNYGTLSVTSNPSGGSVYVDSVSMGMTPITLANIPPGSHSIEIHAPGFLTYTVQATVNAGETTSVSPSLVRNPVAQPLSPITVLAGMGIAGILFISLSARRKNE